MSPLRIILWSIAACMLPFSSSALKVQLQSARAQPQPIASKAIEESIISPPQFHPKFFDGHADGHSERVFRFRQASPHTKSNAVVPKNAMVNEQASHAHEPQWLHSRREATLEPFPLFFHIQKSSPSSIFFLKIALITIFVLMVGGVLSWLLQAEAEEEETDEKDRLQGWSAKGGDQYPASERFSPSTFDRSANPPSRTHKHLAEAVDGTDGTWACTYRRAEATQKEALELLFLCGIIPQNEFATSRVSQEHIDECVWIATHMLRQRSLADWLSLWAEAQQTFEASVTACFSARHDMLTLRSDLTLDQVVEGVISGGSPRPVTSKVAADLLCRSRDRDSSGQNMLISRCREIMAAHTRKKKEEITPTAAQDSADSSPDRETRLPQQAMTRQPQTFLSATPKSSLVGLQQAPPSVLPPAGVTQSQWVRIPVLQGPIEPSMPGTEDFPVVPSQADATWQAMEQQGGSSAACSTSAFGQPDSAVSGKPPQ